VLVVGDGSVVRSVIPVLLLVVVVVVVVCFGWSFFAGVLRMSILNSIYGPSIIFQN